MAKEIELNDGYGGRMGSPFPMPAKRGSHSAYARGCELIVEWYDFGPHAPYESANLLVFDRPTQQWLAEAIGVARSITPHDLAYQVALKFESYFGVKSFAEEHSIPFRSETDFQP